jgi:GntR family transcriptional regulator
VHGEPLALAGLDHLDFRSVYIDRSSTEEVLGTLEGVRSVACATITAKKLRELGIPEELEIIEEDRTLDKGGIEMLGRMLRQLPRAEGKI